jgi:hypothetical protein
MKAQPFEKAIPTCPVCGNAMPEGFIVQPVEEANDVALKRFPNGMAQDSLFDMLQEARREGFIYGANWKEENNGMEKGFIVQLKKDAGVIDADKVHDNAIENMKWVKFSNKPPKGKVFAMLHGKRGLLHVVDKYSVLFDCGGEGWRYDMTDKTVQDFKWLDESSIPADTVGIKCKNITTGKLVTAYHVDKSGAAHNKSNTECIGCIGVDLIPL